MKRLLVALIVLIASSARAAEPTRFRLFAGAQSMNPEQVNSLIKPQGLDEFDATTAYGFEASYQVWSILNIGVRWQGKYQRVTETAKPSANQQNPYFASIQRSEFFFVTRLDLVNTSSVSADLVGGIGGSSARLDVRTSGGEGTYERTTNNAPLAYFAGASAGVGWSNIFLFVEAGQEWTNATSLVRSGTTAASIDEIKGTGTYAMVGLDFHGLPSFIHMTGSKSSSAK